MLKHRFVTPEDLRAEHISKIIADMSTDSTMNILLFENVNVGIKVTKIEEDMYLAREHYYDKGLWNMYRGENIPERLGKLFLEVCAMHFADSSD